LKGPSSSASAQANSDLQQSFNETYRELRRIARSRLHRNERFTLLDTTSLVHECFLKLSGGHVPELKERSEFLAYAATVMRTVVVDHIRHRHAERRGGGVADVTMGTEADHVAIQSVNEILEVNEALQSLAKLDPHLAQVVEMRYFGGFSELEIAEAMNLNERTIRRHWEKARALLRVSMGR